MINKIGFVTVTIESSDGITKTIKSLTHYDEENVPALLDDVLISLLETEYPDVLEVIQKQVKT